MDILKSYYIKSPILSLKSLNNGNLTIVDSQNSLRIFDGSSYSLIGGFKNSIHFEYARGSYVDISNDGKYFISAVPKSNKAAVINVDTKQLISQLSRHHGEIECVGIDPNNRYCATGGQDSKVYIWVLKTSRLICSIASHIDYISTIAFNDTGEWVATGSYDCMIYVLNLSTMSHPTLLRGHKSVVIKISFLSNTKLISADKEGNVIVWNIQKGNIVKRLTKMSDEITSMILSNDKRFIFIGTKLGYIGLYDAEKMEQIKQRFIKEHESITSLAFLDNPYRLAVGTNEGNVRIYSLFGDESTYMSMIHEQQYKAFYEAVEDNPILIYSKPYKKAEQIWNDIVKDAQLLLEQGNKNKAKAMLDLFTGVPKKNAFIVQIIQAYDKFALFQKYVYEARYSLAYPLAKQYALFQDSEPYRVMENRWKKLFFKAQELVLKPKGEQEVQILLAPYRGISEKSILIQQLLNQRRLYEYVKKTIANRDFIKYFELIRIHPFLKEFPIYDEIMEYADKLYNKTQKAYAAGDYHTTLKACEILITFPLYHKVAHDIIETLHAKRLFYDAITSNKLASAFSYLSLYPLLYDTPEAQYLERQWNDILDHAQYFAARGNVGDAMRVFEPYFSIHDKYVAMARVVAQGYCVQIEKLLHSKAISKSIENAICQYVVLFGSDDNITHIHDDFIASYPTQLDLKKLKQGSFEAWLPSIKIYDITLIKI